MSCFNRNIFKVDFLQHYQRPVLSVSHNAPTLDHVEEERLRNKCWLEAASGRYKGRVYGVGQVDSQDDCVQSYLKQTQACSSQQVPLEEINELRQ